MLVHFQTSSDGIKISKDKSTMTYSYKAFKAGADNHARAICNYWVDSKWKIKIDQKGGSMLIQLRIKNDVGHQVMDFMTFVIPLYF